MHEAFVTHLLDGGPITGRFLESEVDAQLQLMAGANATTDRARKAAGRWEKPSTLSPGLTVRAEKTLKNQASLTVPSWNQILQALRELDLLRQQAAA